MKLLSVRVISPLVSKKDPNANFYIGIMGVFGPNISATDGDEWPRHRRIVAPTLNENIMSEVWNSSLTQARDMVSTLSEPSTNNQSSSDNVTFDGLRTIAINVITSVCFGTYRSWGEAVSAKTPPSGFRTTFTSSLLTIVDNLFATIFIPAKYLTLGFLPNSIKKMGFAKTEYPLHLSQNIAEERRSPSSRNSVLALLVKIADQDTKSSRTSKTSTYLTEEDITGNLFNLTIGGFDTTANTLAYAFMCLAAYPELQDWIITEIDKAQELYPDADYSKTFPLLTRSLSIMV